MLRKLYCLIPVALAACLVQNASADTTWSGLGSDGLWDNPLNWNSGALPGNSGNVFLDPNNGSSSITIQAGESFTPGISDTYGEIYGPEWGATLNIYGSLSTSWYLAPVQWNSASPSTINMYGNSSYSSEGIGLGMNWWWNGGPYCTMNLYGNSTVNINYFIWGGHLNLYGGTFTINDTNGVADTVGTYGNDTTDIITDATRMIDLAGGALIIKGDATALVQSWISRGIIEGNGMVGANVDTTSDPGWTVITAPEPSSIALFGLGGFAMMLAFRRRRQVSNS